MTYPASIIADWFLAKARSVGESLTPMKLLKLVYIANGISLGARGMRLVSEPAEAWRWGPVIPTLYSRFSRYGSSGITECPNLPDLDAESEEIVNVTWNVYSGISALRLSALTHQPNTPWTLTYDGSFNKVIPDHLIQAHYEKMLSGSATE